MRSAFEKHEKDNDLEALFLAVMYVANALKEWISFEDIKERFDTILNETGSEWFSVERAIIESFDALFEDVEYISLAEKRLEDIRAGLTRTVPLLDVIDKFENEHGSISTAQDWCSFMKILRNENDFMSENSIVRARINEHIKEEASVVLEAMGLTISDAFRMLLTRIAREKALPFDPLIPNSETIETMKAARHGHLTTTNSVRNLLVDLNAQQ